MLVGSTAKQILPERKYLQITAMGFSAMFTFQLDNTEGKHCRHPIAVMGVVDMFGHCGFTLSVYRKVVSFID